MLSVCLSSALLAQNQLSTPIPLRPSTGTLQAAASTNTAQRGGTGTGTVINPCNSFKHNLGPLSFLEKALLLYHNQRNLAFSLQLPAPSTRKAFLIKGVFFLSLVSGGEADC